MQRQRRRWRFGTALFGAFVASGVIVLLTALFATTPQEARADREPPELGSPTTTITRQGASADRFAARSPGGRRHRERRCRVPV